jgi:hypothetical protein
MVNRISSRPDIELKSFSLRRGLGLLRSDRGQRQGLPVADLVHAVTQAIQAEDRDVSDPSVLLAFAKRCGLDGPGAPQGSGHGVVRDESSRGNTAALSPPGCASLVAAGIRNPLVMAALVRFYPDSCGAKDPRTRNPLITERGPFAVGAGPVNHPGKEVHRCRSSRNGKPHPQ